MSNKQWEVIEVHGVPIGVGIKIGDGLWEMQLNTIFDKNTQPSETGNLREIASRVVRAVNCHDELLAACESLPLDKFGDCPDAADFKDNAAAFVRAMDMARAAIAKARPKQ